MGGSFNTGDSGTVQYQDRKGFDVQNFSSDQTSVGEIYYNTSAGQFKACLLYTSPSPRDRQKSRMPSSA